MKHWTAFLALILGVLFIVSCSRLSNEELMNNAKRLESQADSLRTKNMQKEAELKIDSAIVQLRKLSKRSGQLADEAKVQLGKLLEGRGKFDEAIKMFRKVALKHSQNPLCAEAHYHIALIQANGLLEFDKAISTFGSLIEKYPDTKFAPQAQFMIGFIYANNVVDTTKAREAYTTFLSKYPENELAGSVEWELKYLGKDINTIPGLMGLEPDAEAASKK